MFSDVLHLYQNLMNQEFYLLRKKTTLFFEKPVAFVFNYNIIINCIISNAYIHCNSSRYSLYVIYTSKFKKEAPKMHEPSLKRPKRGGGRKNFIKENKKKRKTERRFVFFFLVESVVLSFFLYRFRFFLIIFLVETLVSFIFLFFLIAFYVESVFSCFLL